MTISGPSKLGIRNIAAMTLREPEIHSGVRRNVQFIWRNVIAHAVTAIVGEPQLLCQRIPIESDAVAYSSREYLEATAVGLHPRYRRVRIRNFANIAGCANIYIEHSIRAKRDELPTVMCVRGKPRVNDLRCRRILQLRFDIVETHDAVQFGDV